MNRLAGVLGMHMVPFWYSTTSIAAGQKWHDEIGAALGKCDWFLVVVSANAAKSKWVKRELTFALTEDRYEDHIIPVIIDSTDPASVSWTLTGFQSIDFTKDFDTACTELLATWGMSYAPGP